MGCIIRVSGCVCDGESKRNKIHRDLESGGLCRAHLGQLGPVQRFVAVEELSSQVTVLPVQVLQTHGIIAFTVKKQQFGSRIGQPLHG